jgi:hypothetical protein
MQKRASFFKKKKKGTPAVLTALVFVALIGLVLAACPMFEEEEEPETYTVSFSAGDGTGTPPSNQKVESGKSITLPNQGNMAPPSGKTTFAGWKAGAQTYEAGTAFTVTGDTTFVAQWSGTGPTDPTTYTVSFSAGEGTGTPPANQTVAAGTVINLPEQGSLTAPSGRTFAGWKTGDTTYSAKASFTVNGNTAFVAQWSGTGQTDPTTYTVSFNAGEGTGTPPANQTVAAGAGITLPNQGSLTAPSGQTFAGWKTGDTIKQAGESFTVSGNTVFVAQWTGGSNGENALYKDFYNYPTGRVDQGGLLTVSNSVAKDILLFNGTVEKGNYLGTVSPLGNVKIKLPDEKFYTIVAVEKENYEERQTQAAQFNVLTYYSNMQPYSVTVSPASTYGSGTWVFNNNTTYWVQIKKSDLSQNYAVIAPSAQRVTIPIAVNTPYDYFVYFSKELKYNGKVVALVEATDRSQANTAQVTDAAPNFTTTIQPANVPSSIKPAVMLKNNSNKSVRVFYANQQKTNGGVGGDLVITGGTSQLVSGFEIGDNTNVIEFSALAWEQNRKVPVDKTMSANKVYEITIPADEQASGITVTEVDSSTYYN